MFFQEDYNSPPEAESPPATGPRRFFQIVSQEAPALLKLNLIFLLYCVPVATIPPALFALRRLSRKLVADRTVRCWPQFWEVFRKEWKRAYAAFLLTAAPLAGAGCGMWFYLDFARSNPLFYPPFMVCAVIFLTVLLASGYWNALLADGRPLTKETVTLALRLGLGKPLRALLAALSWYGLVAAGILWLPFSGMYLLLIGFSIPCLLAQFFVRTVLEKYA